MKTRLLGAAVLAAATLWAGTAGAGLIGAGTRAPEAEPLLSKVATFVCARDDRGWHYMHGSRRVTCRPVRPHGVHWAWHCEGPRCGWWHRHEHRFHD